MALRGSAVSPIEVVQGNLFDSGAQTLVNTVNTVGVMGKGVALQFKERYPEMFKDYRARCERGEVRIGKPYLWAPLTPPWIINFPTKQHWRSPSKLSYIERGLSHLIDHVTDWGVESLAVPPLGCGNGELEWRVVGPVIYEKLQRLDIPVTMHAPFGTPLVELTPDFLEHQRDLLPVRTADVPEFKVAPAAVALVDVLARLESNPLGPRVGRKLFHKLAYFGTYGGLPTGLSFQQGPFGPYAPQFKNTVTRLMNNSLIDEEPSGQWVLVRVGKAYSGARGNFAPVLAEWEPLIGRLVDLFSRMGTRDAEIASTVHFAALQLDRERVSVTELDVFRFVDQWKPDRFGRDDVALAIRNLGMLDWLDVRPSRSLPVPV